MTVSLSPVTRCKLGSRLLQAICPALDETAYEGWVPCVERQNEWREAIAISKLTTRSVLNEDHQRLDQLTLHSLHDLGAVHIIIAQGQELL